MGPLICCVVGDGSHVSFWCDSWLPVGPLIFYCSHEFRCFPASSVSASTSASSVPRDGTWCWPRRKDGQAAEIESMASSRVPNLQVAKFGI